LGAGQVDWTELTELLDSIDGKWDLGILANLEAGPMRPTELCKVINQQVRETGHVLDRAVLTNTLKRLIDDDLIEYREIAGFPRTTLYSLTAHAYDVIAVLNGIDAWYAARRRYWRRRTDEVMHHGPHRLLRRPIRP
jgi:DNA-binding HxlR family transcriptional regulator